MRLSALCISAFLALPLSSSAATRIACIGNSITEAGGHGYVELLQTMFGAGYEMQNDGKLGCAMLRKADVPYWNFGYLDSVFRFNPQIITIKLGINDSKAINWQYSSEFVADYTSMIDTLYTINPRPQIWLCLPTPAYVNGLSVAPQTIQNEIIPKIQSVAQARGLSVIDLNTPFLGRPYLFPDGVHPTAEVQDSIAQIIYRHLAGKPLLQMSDTQITLSYEIGVTQTITPRADTIINVSPTVKPAPVTVSGMDPWLSVSVNAADSNRQILVFNINTGAVTLTTEHQYRDTVTVSSPGSSPASMTFRVLFWVRQPAVFTSIRLDPDTAWLLCGSAWTFRATALNQYGEPLAQQPAFTWNSSAGSVSNGVFTAPMTQGTCAITVSSGGKSAVSCAVVSRFDVLPDSGYIRRFLTLEKAPDSPFIPAGAPTITLDYFAQSVPAVTEANIRPSPGDTSVAILKKYVWHPEFRQDGRFAGPPSRDYFVSYGALYLYLAQPMQAYISYLRDDDLALRIDGQQVLSVTLTDNGVPHTTPAASFPAGVSCLLIKLCEKQGANYYALRLTDAQGRNLRGIHYLLDHDTNAVSSVRMPLAGARRDASALSARAAGGRLIIDVRAHAAWRVTIAVPDGRIVAARKGRAPARMVIDAPAHAAGVYIIKLRDAAGREAIRRVVGE
jgi:alpha-L-fucosidase 2